MKPAMKILIAALSGPAVQGTIGEFVARLTEGLRASDHQVDVFQLPAAQSAEALLEHAYAARFLDVGAEADRLLTIGTACHVLQHPAKICVVPGCDSGLDLAIQAAESREHRYICAALATAFSRSRLVLVDSTSKVALGHLGVKAASLLEVPNWESEHLERGLK